MQPDHDDDLQAPARLVAALKDSCKERIFVPAEVDAAVIGRAREHLDKARSARARLLWQWAAALLLLGILAVALTSLLSSRSHAVARNDFDGDGKVDVLDALALARSLEAQGQLSTKWDLNGDGVVNRQDADAILVDVVALRKAGRS